METRSRIYNTLNLSATNVKDLFVEVELEVRQQANEVNSVTMKDGPRVTLTVTVLMRVSDGG